MDYTHRYIRIVDTHWSTTLIVSHNIIVSRNLGVVHNTGRVAYASRIFTKNMKIADISKQFMEKP